MFVFILGLLCLFYLRCCVLRFEGFDLVVVGTCLVVGLIGDFGVFSFEFVIVSGCAWFLG